MSGGKPHAQLDGSIAEKSDWSLTVPISKINDDEFTVSGWASVTHDGGGIVTDVQDDQIDLPEIVKAAHEFMATSRVAGEMHETMGIGTVVESVVFTPEMQKALGIDLKKVGWFVKMKISDAGVWKRVKSGELAAFSIGGTAAPVAI